MFAYELAAVREAHQDSLCAVLEVGIQVSDVLVPSFHLIEQFSTLEFAEVLLPIEHQESIAHRRSFVPDSIVLPGSGPDHDSKTMRNAFVELALIADSRSPGVSALAVKPIVLELALIGMFSLDPFAVLQLVLIELSLKGGSILPGVRAVSNCLVVDTESLKRVSIGELVHSKAVSLRLPCRTFVVVAVGPGVLSLALNLVVCPLSFVLVAIRSCPLSVAFLLAVVKLASIHLSSGPSVNALTMDFSVLEVTHESRASLKLLIAFAMPLVVLPASLVDSARVVQHHSKAVSFLVRNLAHVTALLHRLHLEVGGGFDSFPVVAQQLRMQRHVLQFELHLGFVELLSLLVVDTRTTGHQGALVLASHGLLERAELLRVIHIGRLVNGKLRSSVEALEPDSFLRAVIGHITILVDFLHGQHAATLLMRSHIAPLVQTVVEHLAVLLGRN